MADAFHVARAQAIRTGNNHLVFFAIGGAGDTAGNTLAKRNGEAVPILVLNDGAPGSANQNCVIDASEEIITFERAGRRRLGSERADEWTRHRPMSCCRASRRAARASSLRIARSGGPSPGCSSAPMASRSPIDAACNAGRLGTGGGTIYLWTQSRDFAITLSPLGGVRVHHMGRQRGRVVFMSAHRIEQSESVPAIAPRRGMTLVEIMVAMVVLSFGLLGVAALQVRAITEGSGGQHLSTASAIARNRDRRAQPRRLGRRGS